MNWRNNHGKIKDSSAFLPIVMLVFFAGCASISKKEGTGVYIDDSPIKTFPLRGIKDSPPYLHDDRLLTLEDTMEFSTSFCNWN